MLTTGPSRNREWVIEERSTNHARGRKKTLQMEVIGLWGVRPGLAEAAAHVVVGLFRRRG
jgi:hypothetical protein